MSVVHVAGGGLAGLSAALRLADAGRRVVLHEASGRLGGRCRSYPDAKLGVSIDNGAHVLVGANARALAFLKRIGSADGLLAVDALPFADLSTGERWTLRPNAGPVPFWLFRPKRRVPGTRLAEYLAPLRLMTAPAAASVGDVLDTGSASFRRLWQPLALAVLNTPAAVGSARLLGRVLGRTLLRGRAACRVYVARDGLGPCFVEPAAAALRAAGGTIRLGARLLGMEREGDRLTGLRFADGTAPLGPDDAAVLALPWHRTTELLPGTRAPVGHHAIVNVHYRLPGPATLVGGAPLLGLIGGEAEWLFLRGEVASVTVSAADRLVNVDAELLAARVWREVRPFLDGAPDAVPPARVVKERRATFAQTPAELARRPGPRTDLRNLVLAGDWTDTGLPATIEGTIVSGERAAAAVARAG